MRERPPLAIPQPGGVIAVHPTEDDHLMRQGIVGCGESETQYGPGRDRGRARPEGCGRRGGRHHSIPTGARCGRDDDDDNGSPSHHQGSRETPTIAAVRHLESIYRLPGSNLAERASVLRGGDSK